MKPGNVRHAALACVVAIAACSEPSAAGGDDGTTIDASDPMMMIDASMTGAQPITVIVIPLKNKDAVEIYGNTTNAPYINGLMPHAAYATMFKDELPSTVPSEPHYVWMEAGTNVFSDRTFLLDSDASSSNSTASTDHLSTQLDAANISWKAYQEGITTGVCPIASEGHYAAKHDPFVFFKDVAGSPPSESNARCAMHHATFSELTADLAAGQLPRYAFITPDLCHDMHGASNCPSGTSSTANVKAGDDWLKANLQPFIDYTHTHNAVLMLVWDEGDNNSLIPFVMIGDHVVPGANSGSYTHSSQLATIERLLGVPKLAKVASATDFSTMFEAGYLPN